MTSKPLREVLLRPERSGRLAKWAIELGEHKIEFQAPTAKKAQVLADFFAEYPSSSTNTRHDEVLNITERSGATEVLERQLTFGYVLLEEEAPIVPKRALRYVASVESKRLPWILQVDGSASAGQGGAGIYLRSPEGDEMQYAISLRFKVTNNEA